MKSIMLLTTLMILAVDNSSAQTDTLRIIPGFGIDSISFFSSQLKRRPEFKEVRFSKYTGHHAGCTYGRGNRGRVTVFKNDSLGISLTYSELWKSRPASYFTRKKIKEVEINGAFPATIDGLIIGKSTKAEVLQKYGAPQKTEAFNLVYPNGVKLSFKEDVLDKVYLFEI